MWGDDGRSDVQVRPKPPDVVEVRVGGDHPADRLVRGQLRNLVDDLQAPLLVAGGFEDRHEVAELHQVAARGTAAEPIDPIGDLVDRYLDGPVRLGHRLRDQYRVAALVGPDVRERAAVGVMPVLCR